MDKLLEVRHLKKYFKTPHGMLHAVDDVNFTLEKSKTLGVVGESGCGKSTLGRTVLNLSQATSGEVLFHGKNIAGAKGSEQKELRKSMQMIFQDPFSSLDPRMSVSEIIGEPLRLFRVCKNEAEYSDRIKMLMDTAGLSERLEHSYPHELDGGRRQRIGIARALALDPEFIVCDEPVSALDVSIQAQILNLMQDLQEQHGLTYMFITHDLSVVKHISDDIMVMYLGQVVEKAPAKKLFINQYHPYTKALLSAIPIASTAPKPKRVLLKGEITSPIDPKPGCRFAPRCLYATEKCYTEQPVLEEVEPQHFVSCHHKGEIK